MFKVILLWWVKLCHKPLRYPQFRNTVCLQTLKIKAFKFKNIFWHFVNKTNLVHNLFLVYLSISTCFGRLWTHHREKQLCFCDTCYLLFCVNDCLVCRGCTLHTRQSSTRNNKHQVSQKHSCFFRWWTHIARKM